MTQNSNFSLEDVAVVSVAHHRAPNVVTSQEVDERLRPFYERTDGKPGLLENLAGIRQRREWPEGVSFTDAATAAGRMALEAAGISADQVGLLIDSSVCRERLEPSSAVTVHHNLGLPSNCMNFDIVNACLGFVNAMHVAGMMIDTGQIEYALIVDGEGTNAVYERTIAKLNESGTGLADIIANFATLTLGSGGAAMVLGRLSANPGSHRVNRGFFQAATQHHELCVGTLDGMITDTRGLLDAGTELAKLAHNAAMADGTWEDYDLYVMHQVSEVHTNAMIEVLGIDPNKVPKTFPVLGNIGPAALPITLAESADRLSSGDRIVCLGIGSGLNTGCIEMTW